MKRLFALWAAFVLLALCLPAARAEGSAAIRLFNEHREDTYLANLGPIQLGEFEPEDTCTYVMIRGPVHVLLSVPGDPDSGMVLSRDGELFSGPEWMANTFSDTDSVKPMFYVERYRDTSILALPRGIDLEVLWEAAGEGTVEVRQAVCSVHASARYPGAASAPVKVSPGMTGVAYTVTDGEAVLPDGFEERVWTAPELASFLGITSAGVSWRLGLTGTTLLLALPPADRPERAGPAIPGGSRE